jgi:hypothetical protein
VAVTGGGGIEDLTDDIERAGYQRPIRNQTEIYTQSGRQLFNEDGQLLSGAVQPLPADTVPFYEDGQAADPSDILRLDYWSVDTDGLGNLCINADRPSDPARIVIDATVGLGTLEILRDEKPLVQ